MPTEIYAFSELKKYLDENNYPIIKTIPFTLNDTNILLPKIPINDSFLNEIFGNEIGIHINNNNGNIKGYMYLRNYDTQKYRNKPFPSFHFKICNIINNIDGYNPNNFRYYYFSNTPTVDIHCSSSGQIFKNITLPICSYCDEITEKYNTMEYYKALLDLQEMSTIIPELDIYKRPIEWDEISRAYRVEMNYTCEICGFGGYMLRNKLDRRFIHTHHKIAWELTNTRRENLQCLCILCHSNIDDLHKEKFSSQKMQTIITEFKEKYRAELKKCGNKYI